MALGVRPKGCGSSGSHDGTRRPSGHCASGGLSSGGTAKVPVRRAGQQGASRRDRGVVVLGVNPEGLRPRGALLFELLPEGLELRSQVGDFLA